MNFLNLLRSKISKDFIIVNIGNFLYAGINFIAIIIIARYLGPHNFGNFSLLFTLFSIILILSDFGLGISMVKFTSEYYSKNELGKVESLLKITFKIRLIGASILCIVGVSLSYFISVSILDNFELTLPVIILFIGGIGLSIYEFIRTYYQSKQEFIQNIIFINLRAFLFLILILFLRFFSILTVFSGIIIIVIVPFIVSWIYLSFLINLKFMKTKNSKINFRKFIKFNIYIMIANMCSMFFYRIDLFYLNIFLGPDTVGYYSAALQIAQILPIIISSINFLLLPKISSLSNNNEIKFVFMKILKYSLILYILLIPIVLYAPFIIPLFYTSTYIRSIPLFQILTFSIGMGFIINPLSVIAYKINKPKVIAILISIKLIIILFAGPYFIIIFQSYGIVYINIIADILFFLALLFYLLYKLFLRNQLII